MTGAGRVYAPHALAASLAVGLAAANAARVAVSVVVAAGVLALAAAVSPRAAVPLFAAALLLAGWWWGSVRVEALDSSVLRGRVGEAELARVVVTGPARRSPFSIRVPADVRHFGDLALRERVLLELPPGRAPPQGAVLELVATVALPREPEEGFDERAWLHARGVHVVLDGGAWRVVGRRGGVLGLGDRLRAHLAANIAPGVGGERRAVIAGIVLGEDEGLSEPLRDSFRASGLYHLLAVSGQNVAFIAGGVLVAAWLLGISRLVAEAVVLLAIAAYVLAVGWQPSVVRAGVAGALASLAWLAARPRDRWYFLLVGAVLLLAWNPYSLREPGFQLSFAAVAAIFVAVPRLERVLEGYPVPRPVAGVAAVSAACGVVTAPLLWLHFQALPVFAIVANLLAAPVVAPLLGLGLLAAAVEPVLPGAAVALGALNGWLAAYLATCARLVGALPHAQVTSWAGLAAVSLLVAAPLAWRRLPARRRPAAALAAAGALAILVGWRLVPTDLPPPKGLRMTFLDVGQGDAVLVQTRDAAVLVDQGPPEADVARQLRRLGVRRLSLVVLTHPQRDHVGGAADVLARLRVDAVLDPRLPMPSPDERAALAEAARRRVPVVVARAGARYRLGRLRLRVLWPAAPGSAGEDPNRRATVLLVSYGEIDALLPADAEGEVTVPLRPPRVEILKVAHHGSADPLLPQLLRLVRPRVAVISVGDGNDYGHPARSTLDALRAADRIRVYRTDVDGRVTLESDGERFEVREER